MQYLDICLHQRVQKLSKRSFLHFISVRNTHRPIYVDSDDSVIIRFQQCLSAKCFYPGDGPIWFDDIYCTGTETLIEQCAHSGWGTHDCAHNEDAAVMCLTSSEENEI